MPPHAVMPSNVLDPILQAGPLARFVLGLLLFFSVICWALIVEKWWEFRAIKRDSRGFMRAFREARRFSLIYGAAKKFRSSPAAQLYSAAGLELSNIYGGPDQVDAALEDGEGLPREAVDAAQRAMQRATESEVARMERYLPFLATTASAAPFIGLFGTVIGIMSAFHGIGQQGSARGDPRGHGLQLLRQPRETPGGGDGWLRARAPEHLRPPGAREDREPLVVAFTVDSGNGGSRRSVSTLAEINIIPLVDVVLVLLLIFMLTAPLMYRGIDVNLPKTAGKPTVTEERMEVTLTKDQQIYLNGKPVGLGVLEQTLRDTFKNRTDKTLYLKADQALQYGFVVETMDRIRKSGIEKLGMVTEPVRGS